MGVLGKALLTGSLLTVIAGIGIVAVVHRSYEGPDGVQSQRFDGIATDLFRFGHTMQLIPKAFEAHVSTFLIKSGRNYILIDAGWPTQNHTLLFMAALKDATRAGTLRWILLTHGYVSVSFLHTFSSACLAAVDLLHKVQIWQSSSPPSMSGKIGQEHKGQKWHAGTWITSAVLRRLWRPSLMLRSSCTSWKRHMLLVASHTARWVTLAEGFHTCESYCLEHGLLDMSAL